MWDLIVSVPDHCLTFYFTTDTKFCFTTKYCFLSLQFNKTSVDRSLATSY